MSRGAPEPTGGQEATAATVRHLVTEKRHTLKYSHRRCADVWGFLLNALGRGVMRAELRLHQPRGMPLTPKPSGRVLGSWYHCVYCSV